MKFEEFVEMMDAVAKKYPSLANPGSQQILTAREVATGEPTSNYDGCPAIQCSVYVDTDGNISNGQTQNFVCFAVHRMEQTFNRLGGAMTLKDFIEKLKDAVIEKGDVANNAAQNSYVTCRLCLTNDGDISREETAIQLEFSLKI